MGLRKTYNSLSSTSSPSLTGLRSHSRIREECPQACRFLLFPVCTINKPPAHRSSRTSKPSRTQDQLTSPSFSSISRTTESRMSATYFLLLSFNLAINLILSAISPFVVIQTTNLAHNNLVSILLLNASWRYSDSLDKPRSFLSLMRSTKPPIRLGCHHHVTRS